MESQELPVYSYSDLLGNPYSQNLHPLMLTEEGYSVALGVQVKGISEQGSKIPAVVIYDKSYVINYLVKKVISQLQTINKDLLYSLIDEAINVSPLSVLPENCCHGHVLRAKVISNK